MAEIHLTENRIKIEGTGAEQLGLIAAYILYVSGKNGFDYKLILEELEKACEYATKLGIANEI